MMRPILGLLLCALALLAALIDARAALAGWLAALVLVSSLPLGALCLLMMVRIIPGAWRAELTEPCNDAVALAPALVLVALPVVIGMPRLFPWFDGGLDGFKALYLAPAFFVIRLLAILIAAAVLGMMLRLTASYRLAIIGLIAFVLLHGLLAVDLVLSLTPDYHSSGFGLYLLGLQMLTALSVLTLRRLPHASDPSLLGRLMMTALLFWAYLSFMQYFILWSGDLVPGAKWFAMRGHGIWAIAEYLIAALRLAFGLLLFFPPIRASRPWLQRLSIATLVGTAIEAAWLVLPSAGASPAIGLPAYLLAAAGLILLAPSARFLPLAGRRTA
jgi:hypothetical protein